MFNIMPTYVRGYCQYSIPTGYQAKSIVLGQCKTTGNMQCSYNTLVITPSAADDTTTTNTSPLTSAQVSNDAYATTPNIPFIYYFLFNTIFYGLWNSNIIFTDISDTSNTYTFL